MEPRNLDLGIALRREQWEQLGRRAAALGASVAGYEWAGDTDRILVYATAEEAAGLWTDFFAEAEAYGESAREVAQLVFNDGRPYAHVELPPTVQPPIFTPQQVESMAVGLERFVREKWHRLLRESGIHYERGHVSPEVE